MQINTGGHNGQMERHSFQFKACMNYNWVLNRRVQCDDGHAIRQAKRSALRGLHYKAQALSEWTTALFN